MVTSEVTTEAGLTEHVCDFSIISSVLVHINHSLCFQKAFLMIGTSFILYFGSRDPEKWLLKTCSPLIEVTTLQAGLTVHVCDLNIISSVLVHTNHSLGFQKAFQMIGTSLYRSRNPNMMGKYLYVHFMLASGC